MKKFIIISFFLVTNTFAGYSKVWTLSDTNLEIRFDDQTALLSVTDKRCSKVWSQSASKDQLTVVTAVQKGNTLNVGFSGKYTFEAVFSLSATSGLEVSLKAENKMPINDFTFPSAFNTPDKNYYLLETDGEGLLLPERHIRVGSQFKSRK